MQNEKKRFDYFCDSIDEFNKTDSDSLFIIVSGEKVDGFIKAKNNNFGNRCNQKIVENNSEPM